MPTLYPHMKAHESAIWERFLEVAPWTVRSIRYDVRLGRGAEAPAGSPDWVQRMVWALSTKRVDAVVETQDATILVEVKDRASLSAVGQLLGYLALYVEQYKPQRRMRLALVCEALAPDMSAMLVQYGIETFIV